ncbi:MAG: RHS repeat-associated core domain-containing protein [Endozoicomonadaceae bacterium]|nr:RHS repeat-associated core domain-containing protein [Endozoicomonadaceae bacterium]
MYSPYGMIWHRKSKTLPLYKQTLYGFDGERRDPATGWQFLGEGHRTYNKNQRYFLSEDPAGDGYAFGSNNPVMNTDPSGNSPKWLGEIFKWADYISTAGLSALHQRWANITAAVIQFGCTVATLGAAAAGAGAIAVAGIVAGAATIGSIPVIAAAIPANRGLNIAGSLIGMAETAVTVATGLLSFSMANEEFELEIPFKMLSAKNGNFCVSEFSCSNEVCVFSGDALDELNLELPAATPTVSQFLQQAPNLKHGSFLEFKTLREVALTWALLRCSPFRDNIACDTGCILLAYYFRQVLLSVEKLENFLKVRNNFSSFEQVIVSPNHPYIVVLNYVLRPLKINKEYVLKPQPFLRIYNLFRFDNIGAIVNSYNHMFIVFKRLLKDSHPWSVYQIFDHGIINTLMNTTDMQEMLRHPRFNTTDFYGYMRFCKHSDLRLE